MTTQGDGTEDAYNRFNFDILTPFYQRLKSFVDENFDSKEEVTKELESMRLLKKRISKFGSEFEKAVLDLYIFELQEKQSSA
jgi:hypothetical protein